jgi:choline monooxygenase
MLAPIVIDADIRRASALPGAFYRDPAYLAAARERIFARSWHLVGDAHRLKSPGSVLPCALLEGCLDEPILLTRDASDVLHCVSNVCTHRGNLLVQGEGSAAGIRCRYHGRRFALDGSFVSMPEFEGAEGFPSPRDDLARVPFARWEQLLFASVAPAVPFEQVIAPVAAKVGWMPLRAATFDAVRARTYLVRASWALYCDNYLEGFHVPFVHPSLMRTIDYASYRAELFDHGNVHIARVAQGEHAFSIPEGWPDHGVPVAAYYFFLFPNTMLNFYPWGLSINVVTPLAVDQTRVTFLPYVWDPSKLDAGAGGDLDRVEREDEAVVEAVQLGVRSRLYDRGRYSPTREVGVHQFHRMIAAALG